MPVVPDLWFDEKRRDVAGWLRRKVDVIDNQDLMARCRRHVPDEDADGIPQCVVVQGSLRLVSRR